MKVEGPLTRGDRTAMGRIVLGHVLAEQVVVVEEVVRVSGPRSSGSSCPLFSFLSTRNPRGLEGLLHVTKTTKAHACWRVLKMSGKR